MKRFSTRFSRNKNVFMYGRLLLWGILCGATVACSLRNGASDRDPAVARVGESYLRESDLERMMPQEVLLADSAEMAEKRVSAWVLQQVLLQKAQANLDEATCRHIERKIDAYRASLMVFSYEEKITRQLLDTIVQERDITDYYEKNKDQFVLKSNIVRLRFVKVAKDAKKMEALKKGLFDKNLGEGDNLYEYADLCRRYADNYFLDGEKWIYFNDFLREVPVKTYNQEEFLRNYRNIEVEAGNYMYYVSILDFKIRDMVSPLSFEKERIRGIILNQRKKTLLDEMERDLMDEARRTGLVEYYGDLQDEKTDI